MRRLWQIISAHETLRRVEWLMLAVPFVLAFAVGYAIMTAADPIDECMQIIDHDVPLRSALHRISVEGPWEKNGLVEFVCECAEEHATIEAVPRFRSWHEGRIYYCTGIARALGVADAGVPFAFDEDNPHEEATTP